jgi:hypothetical protein
MLGIFGGRLVSVLILLLPILAFAQATAPAPAGPPPEVQQLVDLLRKPEVQAWLEQGAPAAAATPVPVGNTDDPGRNLTRDFRVWVADTRSHVSAIRANGVLIPSELARIARDVAAEMREQGPWRILLLTTGLLVLGYGIQKGAMVNIGVRGQAAACSSAACTGSPSRKRTPWITWASRCEPSSRRQRRSADLASL